VKQGKGVLELMTEEHARSLAVRVARTPGHSVSAVRHTWSAMWVWSIDIGEHRTSTRALLLNDDPFDDHLAEAGRLSQERSHQ